MTPTPAAGVSRDSASGIETRTATSLSVWHAPRIAVPRQSATAPRSVRRLMGGETVNAPAQGDRLRGTRAKAIALWMGLQLSIAFSPAVTAGWAQATTVDSLVPAQPVGFVNDFASVISADAAQSMDDLIRRLQGVTGAELAVVTLPSIGDREASEVALAVGRKWKVGAKAEIGDPRRNAGLVLLLVPRREGDPNSGQIRIEVGQGLEGIVTDAAAGQIRDEMRPDVSAGQYAPGLLLGVRILASLIARGYGVTDSALTAQQPPVNPGGGGSS